MDAGFLFDFSTAVDDNDDANVQKKIATDTTCTVCGDADFMIVPEGSECQFEFLSVEQVIAKADSVLKRRQCKDDDSSEGGGDTCTSHQNTSSNTSKANNKETVVFLETMLPFRRDRKGNNNNNNNNNNDDVTPDTTTVSIFHRQAPKVDVLEVVSTNDDNKKIDPTDKRRDIVQGAYYGGLKVWSCAPDVAETVIFGAVENEGVVADDKDSTDSSDEQQQQQQQDAATQLGAQLQQQQRIDLFGDEVRKLIHNVKKSSGRGSPLAITIAELGCGQSLPTLGVMHRLLSSNLVEATTPSIKDDDATNSNNSNHVLVFLHDYNKEVIAEVTLPNVAHALSLKENDRNRTTRFQRATEDEVGEEVKTSQAKLKWAAETNLSFATGYGDWDVVAPSSFVHPTLNPGGYVDILLAADVTFDMEATEKFLVAAARILRPPTASPSSTNAASSIDPTMMNTMTCDGGLAIVGTKDYYFGTNGGLVEMKEVIRKKRLPLKLTVVGKRGVGTMVRVLVALRRV